MNVRRFEHPTQNRFWEVYWDLFEVEFVSGRIGSNGRADRRELTSPIACGELIAREIKARVLEGFEEVVPDLVKEQAAPTATPPPALVQRILEAPDEDQPRMVLSDWLQQQGDPLGELIAVQLEAARTPAGKTVPKRLRDREDSLLASFRARWLPNTIGADVRFVRGFAESVKLELPVDRELLDRVIELAPLLRTLVIAPPRDSWRWQNRRVWELASSRALQRLRGLHMGGFQIDDAGIAAFAASGDLARLDRLGMRSMQIMPSMWKRIAMRVWRELDLHANSLGARGVEYFVMADRRELRALDLGSNEIGDAGVQLLASIEMPALRTLSLRRSKLTAKCMPALARFAQLRTLDISHNKLDEAEVREALPDVRIITKSKTP